MEITDKEETLEEWVQRIKKDPIWREFPVDVDYAIPVNKLAEFRNKLLECLSDTVTQDIANFMWLLPPTEFSLESFKNVMSHTTTLLLHARQEITEKLPEQEHLWRALRAIYQEAMKQKQLVDFLRDKVAEQEEIIESLQKEQNENNR